MAASPQCALGRNRQKSVEGLHADFKSQCTTGNALMGMQDLLTANKVGCERGIDTEARKFLETVTIDQLQDPKTWKRLCGIALVHPENDILPFRTEYETDRNPFMSEETSAATVHQYRHQSRRLGMFGLVRFCGCNQIKNHDWKVSKDFGDDRADTIRGKAADAASV